jgi:hypothetical protein
MRAPLLHKFISRPGFPQKQEVLYQRTKTGKVKLIEVILFDELADGRVYVIKEKSSGVCSEVDYRLARIRLLEGTHALAGQRCTPGDERSIRP